MLICKDCKMIRMNSYFFKIERGRQGKVCIGLTSLATLLDGKRVWAEKNLAQGEADRYFRSWVIVTSGLSWCRIIHILQIIRTNAQVMGCITHTCQFQQKEGFIFHSILVRLQDHAKVFFILKIFTIKGWFWASNQMVLLNRCGTTMLVSQL